MSADIIFTTCDYKTIHYCVGDLLAALPAGGPTCVRIFAMFALFISCCSRSLSVRVLLLAFELVAGNCISDLARAPVSM